VRLIHGSEMGVGRPAAASRLSGPHLRTAL
jgi:hypothetical protein